MILRLAATYGVKVDKWLNRFRQWTGNELEVKFLADPLGEVENKNCDLALVRLPHVGLKDEIKRANFHLVKLYQEEIAVAADKDHIWSELKLVSIAEKELEAERILYNFNVSALELIPSAQIEELENNLLAAAAGAGVCIAPLPLLQAMNKKRAQIFSLETSSWELTEIALVWFKDSDSEIIQDFVGITKGRRQNSSRGSQQAKPQKKLRK